MIYCIILIFVIFSHNNLPVGFSSALKGNWKGIDKKELELELIKKGIGIGIAIFHPKEIGIEIGIERKGIRIELKKKELTPVLATTPADDGNVEWYWRERQL